MTQHCLPAQDSPAFARDHWYEKGIEFANPFHNARFRVNCPEAVLHPSFMYRSEVRSSGMMVIAAEEDLARVAAAELYLELWGGHPGTAAKRVTPNGRTTCPIPEVGTAEGHCTHQYPTIPLKITDLVNGWNALQFACDKGTSFWGHFIVDNACLRFILKDDHPDLARAGLDRFTAAVAALPANDGSEALELTLACPEELVRKIASVHYLGRYEGYDENGDGRTLDWHGFTKHRAPVAVIGAADQAPFKVTWDLSMIPAQDDVAVRAVVRFKEPADILYRTAAVEGLRTPERRGAVVAIHPSADVPKPFWSRASRPKTCTIDLPLDPSAVERAELHVVIWDGGRGKVEQPFTLNGHALPVAGEGRHDVLYRVVDVPPAILKKGPNEIRLLSDTEHHGIEVLLPGPALVVRSRAPGR